MTVSKALPLPASQKVGRKTSRFEYKSLTTMGGNTLRINIELRRSYRDLRLMHRTIDAEAVLPNGLQIGKCSFYTCRRLRNKSEMDADWILTEMDHISESVCDMAVTLRNFDEDELDYCFNQSTLVVADRISVEPSYRGTSLWKEMFALCLRHSLEDKLHPPGFGYLKAFPLEFENNVKRNEAALSRETRRLQLLYAMNLGARSLAYDVRNGLYMNFPIGATTPVSLDEVAV